MTKTVSFANGGEIPVIGFGTWQITGQTCVDAVRTALRSDYRHIDTATMYGNEAEVGAAWQDSGLPRDDVFLTTKLPPRLAGKAHRTLEQSLHSLGTGHVDLWLIRRPRHCRRRGRALHQPAEVWDLLDAVDRVTPKV